jgi:hypothetical protein
MYHGKDGTTVTLRFTNSTKMALNLTIFDFQPLWGIEKLFPVEMEYDTVDPGDCITCRLQLYIPDGWDSRSSKHIDCFKAFITVQPTAFSSLELPALNTDGTALKGGFMRGVSDLQKLFDILGVGNRNGRIVGATQEDWMTAEIEVCTIPDEADTALDVGDTFEDGAGDEDTAKVEAGYLAYIYSI